MIHIQPYPPVFSPASKGPSPRRSRECLCGGQVTGGFAGVAVKDFKGSDKHNIRSRSTDLAKLNP